MSILFTDVPSHLHPGGLLPSSDGVVLEGELVLSDDGSAVFVSDVGHHVHVRGPHLKLSLPVNDGGERSADQEGPLRVALEVESGSQFKCPTDQQSCVVVFFKQEEVMHLRRSADIRPIRHQRSQKTMKLCKIQHHDFRNRATNGLFLTNVK